MSETPEPAESLNGLDSQSTGPGNQSNSSMILKTEKRNGKSRNETPTNAEEGRNTRSQFGQSMPYESESSRLKHKCQDLKQKIHDLETQNILSAIATSRANNAIERLRFEYVILLETLERKALALPIANADKLDADDLDKDNIDSLRLADITQLLSETPLAMARSSVPPSGSIAGIRGIFGSGSSSSGGHGGSRRRRGNGMSAAKRRLRDPNLPKRPTNAYLIFCDLGKEKVRKDLAKNMIVNPDMSKAMTEAWKKLSKEERKPYYDLYEKDKRRYQREVKEYLNNKKKEHDGKSTSMDQDGKTLKKQKVENDGDDDDDDDDDEDDDNATESKDDQDIAAEETAENEDDDDEDDEDGDGDGDGNGDDENDENEDDVEDDEEAEDDDNDNRDADVDIDADAEDVDDVDDVDDGDGDNDDNDVDSEDAKDQNDVALSSDNSEPADNSTIKRN